MNTQAQIEAYLASQPEAKRHEMQRLHKLILETMPKAKLWFLDGRDANGKVVSNPNIGYGKHQMKYADGSSREFYQIGLSGNTSGISIYIMGLTDKNYLINTFGKTIGKASVTGYCIKFKTIKQINVEVMKEVIAYGFNPNK